MTKSKEETQSEDTWEKEFDDLWKYWIFLSEIKTGVNFNAFRDGIKSVVGFIIRQERRN